MLFYIKIVIHKLAFLMPLSLEQLSICLMITVITLPFTMGMGAYTVMEKRNFSQGYCEKVNPLSQQLVKAPLEAKAQSNCFLYDFVSLSYHCGGILTHSFTMLRQFIEICGHFYSCRFLLMSCYSISFGSRSGFWATLSLCFLPYQPLPGHMVLQLTLDYFGINGVHGQLGDCKGPKSCCCKISPNHHIVPQVLLLFRHNFANLSSAAMFFQREETFSW